MGVRTSNLPPSASPIGVVTYYDKGGGLLETSRTALGDLIAGLTSDLEDIANAGLNAVQGIGFDHRCVRIGVNAMPDIQYDFSEPLHKGFGTIAIGNDVLTSANQRTTYSVVIGHDTAKNLVDGYCVTIIGLRGGSELDTPQYTSLFGCDNLLNATDGDQCTAIGVKNGLHKTDASGSILIGTAAYCGGVATNSIIIGGNAADGGQTTSVYNVDSSILIGNYAGRFVNAPYIFAIGSNAMSFNTVTGSYSTGVGRSALFALSSGTSNTAVGDSAGSGVTTGSNNTFIGALADISTGTWSNATCIGYQATVTGSNQLQLGNSSTTTYVYGTVQNRSDLNDKTDVDDTTLGLDFILSLRPRQYRWDMREDYIPEMFPLPAAPSLSFDPEPDVNSPQHAAWQVKSDKARAQYERDRAAWESACADINAKRDKWWANPERSGKHKRKRLHQGFIAQEVVESSKALGIDFGGLQNHALTGGRETLSLGYDEFIAPIVKSIQQMSAMNDNSMRMINECAAQVGDHETRIAKLESEIAALKAAA